MQEKLNHFLLELHAGCRRRPVEQFKDWALDLAQSVVPFGYANWANAVLVNGVTFTFNACARGVDTEFNQRLNENAHLDERLNEAYARWGETILRDTQDPSDVPPDFRRLVLDPAGVRFAALTMFMESSTCVIDGIVLMRGPSAQQFSEKERLLVEAFVPHLHQTRMANQIERGCDVLDDSQSAVYHTIVSNNDGLVIAAEETATMMLLQEWPDWKGGSLPQPIIQKIAAANITSSPKRLNRGRLVAWLHPGKKQTLVRLRAPNVVHTLGERQLMVAERY